jgi:hypothetical protein
MKWEGTMTPIRHEDDYRRKPIKSWDSYVEEAITGAQEEGEFDNLPGFGKPIKIETNPHAPELDFAFSRLKNAGYMPAWMELDQQMKTAQTKLQAFLDDSVAYLASHAEQIRTPTSGNSAPNTRPAPSWWWRLLHGPAGAGPDETPSGPESLADLRDIRDRMRGQYLDRSAELDKRIHEFNNALGRNLWHLERMRLTPERARKRFDEAMGPVDLGEGSS